MAVGPRQGQEQAAPAKKGLIPVLALLPAVKGSQEWGEHSGLGVLWDISDHSLSLHQSTTQLEQRADVLVRAGPPATLQKQQFQT